jgi:hypothetical protein
MTRKRELLHAAEKLGRLVKICGVFGSDHDGERAAAAAMADKIVRDLGLTWADIIQSKQNLLPGPELESQLALIGSNVHMLNDWERRFVQSLHRFPRFSPRQLATITRIAHDLERRAA